MEIQLFPAKISIMTFSMSKWIRQHHASPEIRSFWLRYYLDLQFRSIVAALKESIEGLIGESGAKKSFSERPLSVLDWGSGNAPYRKIFPGYWDWKSLDPHLPADFKSDKEMPNGAMFDLILCIEVLEHIQNPGQEVLAPLHRCLKQEGELWLSVPYSVRLHPCPEDWNRWTPRSLRALLDQHNFEILEFSFRGPFPLCLFAKFNWLIYFLATKQIWSWPLLVILLPWAVLQTLAASALLPMLSSDQNLSADEAEEGDPLGFFVRARPRAIL